MSSDFVCEDHHYTTEIISTDPLLIYINNFISAREAEAIIAVGLPNLTPSLLHHSTSLHSTPDRARTSLSGALPPSTPAVSCILGRARSFLGPALLAPTEDFGTPQIVRYAPGGKFDLHYDWYPAPQPLPGGRRGVAFNRVASFFVYLDGLELESESETETEVGLKKGGGDVGGETWFPYIESGRGREGKGKWRNHEDGGTAFVPRRGSVVFWVNLHANGTGDERVQHAGLPLRGGVKTAMNIWPRRVYG
ncbi:Prolyl 4-hydroxylase [Lachnellula hyalina]|uniref:Prolyl 4-hydroxylase n=1 Tax=Lachnellula hyalina TaxID=1316788 RepID=A0A8H8QXR4_9HELO|nr:Prolyl 4-hydroxylase [Lachnellula hyalina]TVY23685.1 Prolyl 4-hydroxylase [Lachnellula hyalina]